MTITELQCFQRVQWRPDGRELRRFAIAMLVGFLALGLIAAWRSSNVGRGSLILWSVGLTLAVTALIPGLGRAAYLLIYVPSSFIGFLISKLILFLMFFLIFAPLAVVLRWLGKDLLRLRPSGGIRAVWSQVQRREDPDRYYRQF